MAPLILWRFIHYCAVCTLFGGACFPLYGFAPGAARDARELRPLLLGAAVLCVVSGIGWFAAAMPSLAPAEFDVLIVRILMAAALIVPLLGTPTQRRMRIALAGSFLLLASTALTGHAGSDESQARILHRILDVFHLTAAGVWAGALAVFASQALRTARDPAPETIGAFHYGLARFSDVGPIMVIALALSGILNPAFLSSFSSRYGQVLLAKLALFGAMLALAALNRYWLVPGLTAALSEVRGSGAALRALRVSVLLETALAVFVLFLVGWLGVLPPSW
jgi:copper resistance protein D